MDRASRTYSGQDHFLKDRQVAIGSAVPEEAGPAGRLVRPDQDHGEAVFGLQGGCGPALLWTGLCVVVRLLILRGLVLFDLSLQHGAPVRLVHAVFEGAQLVSPHLNFLVGLPDEFGGIAAARAARLLIEGQRLVLIDLGLIQNREAMTSFRFKISRMIVEPAVRAADGKPIVFTLRAEDIRGRLSVGRGGNDQRP